MNYSTTSQRGMGLIEVLVALILLAIAILGFSALQLRAVGATDESLIRSRASSVIYSLSESMRVHIDNIDAMKTVINGTAFDKNCASVSCTAEEMAKYDAQRMKTLASNEGFNIAMQTCPGTASGQPINCVIISWKGTNASIGSADTDCVRDTGVYNSTSTCLMMETY